jgi:hypothetical protein
MLESTAADADTLAKTLCKKGVACHIDELIFNGRRTCVDNKNFHLFFPFNILIRKDFTTILSPMQEIFVFSFSHKKEFGGVFSNQTFFF